MRLLIVTDAFPPRCGGSGWSASHLAKGLARAGHDVRVVEPSPGLTGVRTRRYEDIEVCNFGFVFRDVPYLRSILREKVLARRLREFLKRELGTRPVDLVHAQHLLSASPAVAAAKAVGVPAVVTVRDYWPRCYFTTAHVGGESCPDCSVSKMLRCMREKSPRGYLAGIPMIPYMRKSVRRRQMVLREADAVVAVSGYIADRVVRPIVGEDRTHVIPNSVDLAEILRVSREASQNELPERFLLFAGKLNALKGALFALEILQRLRHRVTLLMLGQGVDAPEIERRAAERRLDVRLLPWVDNAEVLRIMRRATLVLVPSLWPEPLSRTVTEAMAVGVPIAATDSGGIHDQLVHGESGLVLPRDAGLFAQAVDRLLEDPPAAERFVAAARARVQEGFDHSVVLPKLESVYRGLLERGKSAADRWSSEQRSHINFDWERSE
jgi:glycogen synthase